MLFDEALQKEKSLLISYSYYKTTYTVVKVFRIDSTPPFRDFFDLVQEIGSEVFSSFCKSCNCFCFGSIVTVLLDYAFNAVKREQILALALLFLADRRVVQMHFCLILLVIFFLLPKGFLMRLFLLRGESSPELPHACDA